MRQAGILAAAGLHALDHHVERLEEDHANARTLARQLSTSPNVILDPTNVQTNIILFQLANDAPDAETVVDRVRQRGVLMFALGPKIVRMVTHLDVSRVQCEQAGAIVLEALDGTSAPAGRHHAGGSGPSSDREARVMRTLDS